LTGWRSRRSRASSGRRRLGGPLGDAQQHLAPDHHRGQAAGVGVRALDGADHAAVAHDAHAVADLHHLVELVRDEHDGVAVGRVAAQELEQAARLLRRQDGGRLVHDQDAGVAEQGLEDLDLLLQADRELVDARVGIEVEAEALDDLACLAARGGDVERRAAAGSAPRTRFSATVRVSTSMKCWCTMPMPCVDGVAGGVHRDLAAVDLDAALVRRLQAVEDLHQRALAGAVLADQGVHLAPGDLEVDAFVGDDQREALADALHADGGWHAAC
jgi:hypothetical protein